MPKSIEERLTRLEELMIKKEPFNPIQPIVFVDGKRKIFKPESKVIEKIENPIAEDKHKSVDFSKGKDA